MAKAKKTAPKAKPKKPAASPAPKGKPVDFPIADIKMHPKLQIRIGGDPDQVTIDKEHVEHIQEAVRKKVALPRVQLWRVPGMGVYATDGHHTILAYSGEGRETVPAELHEGTWDDAEMAATAANKEHHAKPRTMEEKRRAVHQALDTLARKGEDWTNTRIALQVGVSDDLVKTIRTHRAMRHQPLPSGPKVGSDGKAYTQSGGKKPGKQPAEPPKEKPAEPPKPAPQPQQPTGPNVAGLTKDFDGTYGSAYRAFDVAASALGVMNTPRTENIRKLFRELKDEFDRWIADHSQPKGKP